VASDRVATSFPLWPIPSADARHARRGPASRGVGRFPVAGAAAAKTNGRQAPAPLVRSARDAPTVVTRRQDHRGRPDQDHPDDWCQCSSPTPSTVVCDSRPRAIQNGKGANPRRLLGGFRTCIGQTPVPRGPQQEITRTTDRPSAIGAGNASDAQNIEADAARADPYPEYNSLRNTAACNYPFIRWPGRVQSSVHGTIGQAKYQDVLE
jgi:hypothetical protein